MDSLGSTDKHLIALFQQLLDDAEVFKTKLEALQTYADAIKADGDPAEHQQVLDTIAQLQQRYEEV